MATLKDITQTVGQIPALRARQSIPAAKRASQWRNTAAGAVFVGLGLVAPKYLGFPWYAGLGISTFGAFIASKQLVVDFLKVVPQAIGAIYGAIGGKTPTPEEPQ